MENQLITQPNPKGLWRHPILPIFDWEPEIAPENPPSKLYLVPTLDNLEGESVDPECLPQPSHLHELPNISNWVRKYAIGVIEIWNGKRPAMQLARWSHRKVFQQLIKPGHLLQGFRIRKIYISEPISGVIEATITLNLNNRVRSLCLRFEGVDKRWLCTELVLL